MCDVCCAGKAVDATEKGQFARFVWNPSHEPGALANNPDAPPAEDYTLTPADWPFVLVQAISDEWHNEGKGRFRFGFAEDDMSDWIEATWLSSDIDQLGISWAWDMLNEDLQQLLLSRDVDGILKHWATSPTENT